jgi:hypothetical protein
MVESTLERLKELKEDTDTYMVQRSLYCVHWSCTIRKRVSLSQKLGKLTFSKMCIALTYRVLSTTSEVE